MSSLYVQKVIMSCLISLYDILLRAWFGFHSYQTFIPASFLSCHQENVQIVDA